MRRPPDPPLPSAPSRAGQGLSATAAEPGDALAQARPTLALLASIASGRLSLGLPTLHRLCAASVSALLRGRPEAEARRAAYALAVTADEIALNLPAAPQELSAWADRSLASQFFGEAPGAEAFWTMLEAMVGDPQASPALLELFHACMAAGFQGHYRASARGTFALNQVMARTFEALERARRSRPGEPPPPGEAEADAAAGERVWGPVLLAAAGAASLLGAGYFVLSAAARAAGKAA
ncbi:MAG TPA: DotU/TssL family secretion system protein [Caulobacteraceae bacterium]|nr:DotU/TssL family secretion system protein [Caulobacteraceae bacterium]